MRIIDSAISEIDLETIQNLLLGINFSWYFFSSTINKHTIDDDINDFQLCHSFYAKAGSMKGYSEHFKVIEPILDKLKIRTLIRIKANLRTVAPKQDMIAGWHTDTKLKSTTAIFYVNTNNGYTIFKESKKKVKSVENRLVIFPTELEHCGVSCTDNKQRVVINFNYIKE
tara:strand:+ start:438 stop:947 length:510 start_codon:yes stop_codon:yes gene_type:complete